MNVQIRFRHPDGRDIFEERSPGDAAFTIGRSRASTYAFEPMNLSRTALRIEAVSGGRVAVMGGQQFGYIRITRDGVEQAVLSQGAEHILGSGTYTLQLKLEAQELLTLELEVPAKWRPVAPGSLTQGMWNLAELLNPVPRSDWRWLAAMTTIAWRTGAARKTAYPNLKLLGQAWHGGEWKVNVSARLDKVLQHLGYEGTYPDKIAVIADDVLHAGVIAPADYQAFENEVKRRAVLTLSRQDLGTLGWGRLAP